MTKLPKFDDARRYWLSGKKLNEIMRAIDERTPIAGTGLLGKTVPQGIILNADVEALRAAFPWQVSIALVDEEWQATLEPATLNGDYPLIGTDPIDESPTPYLVVPETGICRIYLEVATELTFTDGYLTDNTTPTAELKIDEEVPEDEADTVRIVIATIEDHVVTAQPVRNSLWVEIRDTGDGETGTFIFTNAG